MIEGFIEGLKARRPALFNLYTSCQPEHGIGDDMSAHQAKLAVESRAFPLFRYNPRSRGPEPAECFDLEGNPELDSDWPRYTLTYLDAGREKTMDLPMTFADFAATEIRFRKHFRVAPPESWNDTMMPLAEYLACDPDDRQDRVPYIWSIDRGRQLMRLLVAEPMVESCTDRRDFWTMLRAIAGVDDQPIDREEMLQQLRRDLTSRLAAGIMRLVSDENSDDVLPDLETAAATAPSPGSEGNGAAAGEQGDYLAPWIDTALCTACDECTRLNPKIFAYNDQKKAYIKDPQGGPYRDLVKAAERCTAQIIHPGLPKDRGEKDVDKWIARAEKYNG